MTFHYPTPFSLIPFPSLPHGPFYWLWLCIPVFVFLKGPYVGKCFFFLLSYLLGWTLVFLSITFFFESLLPAPRDFLHGTPLTFKTLIKMKTTL